MLYRLKCVNNIALINFYLRGKMDRFNLHHGDCLAILRMLPDNSVDSIVTDPPYGLSKEPDMAEVLRHWLAGDDYQHTGSGFMGKSWDSFVPGPSVWRECLRVLKPGGHLLAFFGARTQDLGTLAIRLAGFEIRDSIAWMYGSGFPKNMDVSKQIDKMAGVEREVISEKSNRSNFDPNSEGGGGFKRGTIITSAPATEAAKEWDGWGTALKPAHEPITMARKPFKGSVTANVLAHGTGALNINACRIGTEIRSRLEAGFVRNGRTDEEVFNSGYGRPKVVTGEVAGRWPANPIHDGSDEVLA
ncbi:DNA methyltransferase, partial [Bacillus altitudinis]|uniref:DNA methyltransferase n=1 Tax=Bacillus altitudinis TaxID=293387 RepID=UPI003671C406